MHKAHFEKKQYVNRVGWGVLALISTLRRHTGACLSLRSTCSTYQVSGQPEPYNREILSQKHTHTHMHYMYIQYICLYNIYIIYGAFPGKREPFSFSMLHRVILPL